MASSGYCQGLQSCLEMEEPRVVRLKLAPPETNILPPNSKPPASGDYDSGGWSFLQSLAKNEPVSKDEVYIPPNCKRGASALSKKSLEMCTESLGSETGSDGGDSGDELNLLSAENRNGIPAKSPKLRETRRMNRSLSFPPPLSSISSGGAVQMRPRREGGRLVLEAVSESNSSPAYLKVERIDGRLKLHLVKNCDSDEEDEEENEENLEEEEEEDAKENGEFEMEKLKRISRCGSSSLLNWEPFWVAT